MSRRNFPSKQHVVDRPADPRPERPIPSPGYGSGGSAAELLLEVQLRQAGIWFEREYRFAPPRRWRADFMIPDDVDKPTLLVEIDGGGYVAGRHSRGTGIEKDAEKQSAAAILGYRVIRVTPKQVNDGRALSWIKQALGIEEKAA